MKINVDKKDIRTKTYSIKKHTYTKIKFACMFQHLKGKMHINVLFRKVRKNGFNRVGNTNSFLLKSWFTTDDHLAERP